MRVHKLLWILESAGNSAGEWVRGDERNRGSSSQFEVLLALGTLQGPRGGALLFKSEILGDANPDLFTEHLHLSQHWLGVARLHSLLISQPSQSVPHTRP